MRKILKSSMILLFSLLLFISSLPMADAAEVGTYIVTADTAQMLSEVSEAGVFLCNVKKGTVVEVTEIRLGFGKVTRKSVSLTGWINMNDLAPVSPEYSEDNIVDIDISLPEKLEYIVGEEAFDRTGLAVYVHYANNDIIEVHDYVLYMPSFDTIGAKTVTVFYQSFSSGRTYDASFVVSVVRVPVSTVSPEGSYKTEFVEGMPITFDGLAVRVHYSDGRTDRIFTWSEIKDNPDFSITVDGNAYAGEAMTLGKHTVAISYMYPDRTAVYDVNVVEKQPAELQVLQPPYVNYFYSDTREPNLNGLILSLIYNNGTKESISYRDCKVIFDAENAVPGMNEVILRYENVETQVQLEMIEPSLTGIEIADPGRTVYIRDALFDGNKTIVNGIYNSGTKAELSGWTVYSFDTQTCGEKTVELRYGEFSAFYTIYVTNSGYLYGDADLDGRITASDARLILRCSVELEELSGTALFAADRNGNGSISSDDARSTLRASVGLEPVYVEIENNE